MLMGPHQLSWGKRLQCPWFPIATTTTNTTYSYINREAFHTTGIKLRFDFWPYTSARNRRFPNWSCLIVTHFLSHFALCGPSLQEDLVCVVECNTTIPASNLNWSRQHGQKLSSYRAHTAHYAQTNLHSHHTCVVCPWCVPKFRSNPSIPSHVSVSTSVSARFRFNFPL